MISDRDLHKHGESFLQAFEAIRRALSLYPANHPNVTEQLNRFLRNLADLRDKVGETTFNVANREFFVNGVALKRISITYEKNLAAWEQMGLGLVRFDAEATPESILRFFEVIGRGAEGEPGGLAAALQAAGVHGIRATRVSASVGADEGVLVRAEPMAGVAPTDAAEARARYRDSVSEFAAMVEAACETAGSSGRMIRTVCHAIEAKVRARRPVREALEQLEEHDVDAARHAVSGAIVAVAMGAVLRLPRERLVLLAEAAVLRDLGMLQVSPAALQAAAKDEEARREVERHPALGALALLRVEGLDASAAIVALEHHAGHDGKGFPRLRARRGLHPFSRLVAVASDYDRAVGGYHGTPRVPPAQATLVLARDAGTRYDPGAVRALLRLVGVYPEGTAVTLRDGTYGVVAGPGARTWVAPEVVRIRDAAGNELEPQVATTDALVGPGAAVVLGIAEPSAEDGRKLARLQFAV